MRATCAKAPSGESPVRGLTALEALLVLVIVGLGAAILFPIFVQPREGDGHRTNVLSNCKQISLAIMMYASDYDEHLPPSDKWIDSTYDYVKNDSVYRDPTVKDRKDDEYGFAFYEPVSLADLDAITNDGEVPMVFQSVLMGKNAHSDLSSLPFNPRGRGRNYVAFCDGHTMGLPADWPKTPIVIERKK